MTIMQLELPFMTEDPILRAIKVMEERFERNRKALHAKNGEVKKQVDEINHRLSMWEQSICQGTVGIKS